MWKLKLIPLHGLMNIIAAIGFEWTCPPVFACTIIISYWCTWHCRIADQFHSLSLSLISAFYQFSQSINWNAIDFWCCCQSMLTIFKQINELDCNLYSASYMQLKSKFPRQFVWLHSNFCIDEPTKLAVLVCAVHLHDRDSTHSYQLCGAPNWNGFVCIDETCCTHIFAALLEI